MNIVKKMRNDRRKRFVRRSADFIWQTIMMAAIFAGLIFIFLYAIPAMMESPDTTKYQEQVETLKAIEL